MPSLRLVSLAAQQESKKDFRWIAWRHCLSQERTEEIQIARPSKQARRAAIGLSSVLIDEPPTLEVSNVGMGLAAVARVFSLHDMALALVGSAHLARLKAYSSRFMQLLSSKNEPESGL